MLSACQVLVIFLQVFKYVGPIHRLGETARDSVQQRFRTQLRQETKQETALKESGLSQSYAMIGNQIVDEFQSEGAYFCNFFKWCLSKTVGNFLTHSTEIRRHGIDI